MPEYTEEVEILWAKYLKINKGCEQVTYQALESYQNISGDTLDPWESDLMIELDIMRRTDG